MFNKRLQHDFIIPNEGLYRVYLLEESDTGGTWPVIKGEGMPVTLTTGNRNNTIYAPILPSTLTWRIVIQNQAARDVIDAVFESIEGDYRVEYYQVEGGITENLIWRGDLLLDQYNEDLRGFPGFVEIVASDLGKLQGLNYLDVDGFPHTGRESQLQIIKNCVQLLGYDLGFACSDAIFEDTMDGDPLVDDPMLQAYADNAWYYPVDSFGQTRLMTAWDVLRSVLVSKACRIRQWGGRWHVEQIGEGVAPDPFPESNLNILIGGTFGLFRVVDMDTTPPTQGLNLFFESTALRHVAYDEQEGYIAATNSVLRVFNADGSSRFLFSLLDFRTTDKPWVSWDGWLYMAGYKQSDRDVAVFYRVHLETAQYVRKEERMYLGGDTITNGSICLSRDGRVFACSHKSMMELDYQTFDILWREDIAGNQSFQGVFPGELGSVYYIKTPEIAEGGLRKINTDNFSTTWEVLNDNTTDVISDGMYYDGKIFLIRQLNLKGLIVYSQDGSQLHVGENPAQKNEKVAVDTFGDIYMSYSTAGGGNINSVRKYSGIDYTEIWGKSPFSSDTVEVRDFDVHPGRARISNNFQPRPPLPDIDVPIVSAGTFTYGGAEPISEITGDIPVDPRTGSWLIATLMHRNATEAGITPPSGWELIVSQKTTTVNASTNQYLSMYRFIDDGSLGDTVTFESAVTDLMGLCIVRVHRINDGPLGYGKIVVGQYSSTAENPGQEFVPSVNVENPLNAAIAATTCLFAGTSSFFNWTGGWQRKDSKTPANTNRLGVASKKLEVGQSIPNVISHEDTANHDSAQILLMIEVGGSATPDPQAAVPPITNFKGIPGDGRVSLSWEQDDHPDVDVYYIRRDGNPLVFCPNGLTDKQYLVTGLNNDQEYEFQIWAIKNPCGTEVAVRTSVIIAVTPGKIIYAETGAIDSIAEAEITTKIQTGSIQSDYETEVIP